MISIFYVHHVINQRKIFLIHYIISPHIEFLGWQCTTFNKGRFQNVNVRKTIVIRFTSLYVINDGCYSGIWRFFR